LLAGRRRRCWHRLSEAAGLPSEPAMDSLGGLRFVASMGVESAMESFNSAQERAKELAAGSMERMSTEVSSGVNRVRQVSSDMANVDLSRLELGASIDKLKESAISTGASISSMSMSSSLGGFSSPTRTSCGQSTCEGSAAGAARSEEGSDGEEAKSSGWSSLSAVFGMQAQRSSEKEQLVPKRSDQPAPAEAYMGESYLGPSLSGLSSSMSSSMSSSLGGVTSSISSLGSGVLWSAPAEEPKGLARVCSCCPALTARQRMIGFLVCFGLGSIMTLSALSSFGSLLIGNPAPFAFKYTAGNLLSIGSSSFLVGPAKQLRDMLAPERFTASVVYALTLFGTLTSIFYLRIQILTFLFILMQMAALTWYMLSYVPYGQQCVRRLVKRMN